jgi:ABC-type transport system involved in multi-copper enzyme maturation permease subunit
MMMPVILRELQDNLKNFKLLLLVVFSISLFTINGLVFPDKYMTEQTVEQSQHNTSSLVLSMVPQRSPYQFLSEGGDQYGYKQYTLSPGGIISPYDWSPLTRPESGLPNIPELDWAFIIRMVFALYVILLGYNVVCGESEQGTLRLVLSNPLGRVHLLFAKYAVLMITTAIPLLLGMAVNLVILGVRMPDVLAGTEQFRIVIMAATSLVYLSVFALLSLLVSSLIKQPPVALLMLMVAWIVFATAGDIAGVIAHEVTAVPREIDILKESNIRKWMDTLHDFRERAEAGEFTSKEKLLSQYEQIFIDTQETDNRQTRERLNASQYRVHLSRNLSRFSPSALFQYAAENIAGTGYLHEERFINDLAAFAPVYDDFLVSRVGWLPREYNFSGSRYSVVIAGEKVQVETPRLTNRPFEESDIPMFVERQSSISGTLRAALADLAGLLIWNIILAMGAIFAIRRADVR